MYNKAKTILKSNELTVESYIENEDIYNSKFLYMLRMLPAEGEYEVNLSRYRIDLIARDMYSDTNMSELILLYNGITISDLKPGVILKYPSISNVEYLISKLNTINSPREFFKSLENR